MTPPEIETVGSSELLDEAITNLTETRVDLAKLRDSFAETRANLAEIRYILEAQMCDGIVSASDDSETGTIRNAINPAADERYFRTADYLDGLANPYGVSAGRFFYGTVDTSWPTSADGRNIFMTNENRGDLIARAWHLRVWAGLHDDMIRDAGLVPQDHLLNAGDLPDWLYDMPANEDILDSLIGTDAARAEEINDLFEEAINRVEIYYVDINIVGTSFVRRANRSTGQPGNMNWDIENRTRNRTAHLLHDPNTENWVLVDPRCANHAFIELVSSPTSTQSGMLN
jgi:hypothetical protein